MILEDQPLAYPIRTDQIMNPQQHIDELVELDWAPILSIVEVSQEEYCLVDE